MHLADASIKSMKRLIATVCAVVPAALLAGGMPATKAFTAAIGEKDLHEECQRIEAGGRRTYSWKSDTPVDFNIHYHRGDEVSYPVKRSTLRADAGTFTAKTAEDYCWMWSARGRPAKVQGRLQPR